METIQEKARKEVKANYSFFKKKSAELEKKHHGKFVLLHRQQIKGYYDTDNDAMAVGKKDYGEGNFSVQEIGASLVDLGYQSYAIP